MAVAIMGGLVVGTALTLLFLPALYAAWFRVRRPNGGAATTHGATGAPPSLVGPWTSNAGTPASAPVMPEAPLVAPVA